MDILDNSFTTKLSYLILLNYLISFLIYNLLNSIRESVDIGIDYKLSNTNDSWTINFNILWIRVKDSYLLSLDIGILIRILIL